jgi:transcriptional regulator with XRE-family HTH domain
MSTTFVRLRAVRVEAGVTQAELASRSGVSERTIRRLEREVGPRVSALTLMRLARALDVSFTSFIEDTSVEYEERARAERRRLGVA